MVDTEFIPHHSCGRIQKIVVNPWNTGEHRSIVRAKFAVKAT
jgi:hypothetical protein